MEPLVSLVELMDGLEWELDAGEQKLAIATLEDLSDDARYHGLDSWTDEAHTPEPVRRLIKRVARRFMRNPDGYVTSRAGDEAVSWSDRGERGGTASFNDNEVAMLRGWAGKAGIASVELYHGSPRSTHNPYVSVEGGKPFPYYADGDG